MNNNLAIVRVQVNIEAIERGWFNKMCGASLAEQLTVPKINFVFSLLKDFSFSEMRASSRVSSILIGFSRRSFSCLMKPITKI